MRIPSSGAGGRYEIAALVTGNSVRLDVTDAHSRIFTVTRRIGVGLLAPQETARLAPLAGRLTDLAACLLPDADRARYAEEYGAELWDLAHGGTGRLGQLGYGVRQIRAVFRLRGVLRAPRRRGAAP